jgi:hypothetical protein
MSAPRNKTFFSLAERDVAVANSVSPSFSSVWQKAIFLLNVSATDGAAGDTLDVFIDVLAPDGVTWMNAAHFTQVAGNAAAGKFIAVLDASTYTAATPFVVTADAAAGATRPYVFGPVVRSRYTLVDAGLHGQSVTFSVSGTFI